MCMQDLAISARITWRPITVSRQLPNSYFVIDPNPLRVALIIGRNGGSGPQTLYMLPSNTSAEVNTTLNTSLSHRYVKSSVTVFEYPGIFNVELFCTTSPLGGSTWEAVMDSDLSKAVQAENVLISSKGG